MNRLWGVFLVAFAVSYNAGAETRLGLVIGAEDYKDIAPLSRSTEDALDMGVLLGSKGYKITYATDIQNKASLTGSVAKFANAVREEAAKGPVKAVVYYSGHAVEAYGQNYLLTPNFKPGKNKTSYKKSFEKGGYNLNEALLAVTEAGASSIFFILDACRVLDKKLGPPDQVGTGFDLTYIQGRSTILFASSMGQPSYSNFPDEINHRNSVYTSFFLKRAVNSNITVGTLNDLLQVDVRDATVGLDPSQIPMIHEGVPGNDFLFNTGGATEGNDSKSTIRIFFADGRLKDAQALAAELKNEGVSYAATADNFSSIKIKLSPGSYKIAYDKAMSAEDRLLFVKTLTIVQTLAGDQTVKPVPLEPNQIASKPFQIQLF